MSDQQSIGTRVRALRKQRDETQAVVAEAIGIERATLTGIERGSAAPGRMTLFALATYFNVSADWLATGEGCQTMSGADQAQRFINDPDELAWMRLYDGLETEDRPRAAAVILAAFRVRARDDAA